MITAFFMFALCLTARILFKGNQIRQITCYSCIYLITLTIVQEMDIVFSIYWVFCIITMMSRKKVSVFLVFYIWYLMPYVIIGLFFQEFWNTASVLLTRFGFLIIGLLMCSKYQYSSIELETEGLFVVRIGTITEISLAVYLSFFGDLANRLTINSQAIGGSISIGLIPIICTLYFANRELWNNRYLYFYWLVNIVIIGLSGTRGYMVIAFLSMIPMLVNLFGRLIRRRRLVVICSVCFLGLFFIFFEKQILELLMSTLRMGESVGYRVYENDFIKRIFDASPWWNKLFGFGLGGRADNVAGYEEIVLQSARDKEWMISKLMTETTVHNYWYTILFKQGVIGCICCGSVLLVLLRKIFSTYRNYSLIFWTLNFMFVGCLVSLTFRISATCGMWETYIMMWIAQQFYWKNLNICTGEERKR